MKNKKTNLSREGCTSEYARARSSTEALSGFLLAPRARVGRRFAPPRRLRASAQNLKSHSQYMNQKYVWSETNQAGCLTGQCLGVLILYKFQNFVFLDKLT